MKIGVMGTGGVGGYFGAILARAGVDIHFVARGKHRQAIQEEGLQVISSQGNFRVMVHATSEPEDIGPVDLLLFCVKAYDTMDAMRVIGPMIEEDTMILSLQNGIDNNAKLSELYDATRVLGGTTYIESSIASPGVIAHSGRPGRIIFGELTGERTPRAEKVLQVFQKGGIDTELSTEIENVLWQKFLFICGVHGVTTLPRASLGLALAFPETRDLMVGVMREVESLARAKGIHLPVDVVQKAVELAETYTRNFKCSMLRDLQWRRRTEVEALNGMVVQMGREFGIETPLNQVITACLKLENYKILNPFLSASMDDFF